MIVQGENYFIVITILKKIQFDKAPNIILHFGGTNNIFVSEKE